ncbi:hypothetical protein SAMN04489724_2240 [Algoriphagus locisalis]|uniref:Uncharacterized protein n=1 Tax=Algoriphagus locisalis TaxID=305507 RepID=A0A1I7AVP1_9BACT|nr:hypothetical protein [Algoriphagus locisalis]SFT78971.1 hypothetical protein SAMN04489724_2240 [Algoriphagus locisalis]
MTLIKDFSFKKLTIISLAVLGLCFCAGSAMAQSERDKPEGERERPLSKPQSQENMSDVGDVQVGDNQPPVVVANPTTSAKTVAPKKDTQVSGEGKKPETTSSTLSFNIFLYIVDKFKAD